MSHRSPVVPTFFQPVPYPDSLDPLSGISWISDFPHDPNLNGRDLSQTSFAFPPGKLAWVFRICPIRAPSLTASWTDVFKAMSPIIFTARYSDCLHRHERASFPPFSRLKNEIIIKTFWKVVHTRLSAHTPYKVCHLAHSHLEQRYFLAEVGFIVSAPPPLFKGGPKNFWYHFNRGDLEKNEILGGT
jgi:hypothetical protein